VSGPDPSRPTHALLTFVIVVVMIAILAGYWAAGYLNYW
jgi:hypothetical protein